MFNIFYCHVLFIFFREGDNVRDRDMLLNRTKTNHTELFNDENNATTLFDDLDQVIDNDLKDLIVGDLGEYVDNIGLFINIIYVNIDVIKNVSSSTSPIKIFLFSLYEVGPQM